MDWSKLPHRPPWGTPLLAIALGVLPHLLWLTFGFAGGLFVALLYPALAGCIGWRIRSAASGRCWRKVLLAASIGALSFTSLFIISAPDLSQFYGPLTIIAGGIAVFTGAFLAGSTFMGFGVAARNVRQAA